jgi:LruC domain-containing protein
MRNNIKQLKWLVAFVLVIFASCKKGDSNITPTPVPSTGNAAVDALLALNPPASFNYEMQKDVNLDITILAPDNSPIKNIPISIFTKSEELGGILLFKSLTDNQGKISGTVKLSTALDQVVIDAKYLGVIRNAAVNIVSGAIMCTLGGSNGYLGNVVPNSPLTGGRPAKNTGVTLQKPVGTTPPYSYMGTYDNQGKPNYLLPANDLITADFLANINASLPEGRPIMTYHPDYLASDVETNANINALSDVWFTFITEGAGYRNSIAYFTYPTNNPPKTTADIDSLHFILPNASLAGSGGSLQTGNTIKLGRFSAGTSIGFALVANGWNGTVVGAGNWIVYSIDNLNPEPDPTLKRHSVFLYDNAQKLFLIGMEDIRRDNYSDNDFNDCLFYIKSNPVTAISVNKVNPIDKPVDTDGDGVNDVYDDFPNDATRAYINYYPSATTMGTVAFEDYWPFLGDYDMNDLVVDYRYSFISNALNNAVEMNAKYVLKASGASYRNGFGVQFPFLQTLVKSATGGLVTNTQVVTLGANGLESGQTKAVIIPFDDAYNAMKANAAFNTNLGGTYLSRDTISMNLTFTRPLLQTEMGAAPYNPFIIINRTRGREAHLPGNAPTDKVDTKYFKTGVDNSNPAQGIYYKTTTNLPWGLGFVENFSYPSENKAINTAFLNFESWVKAAGASNANWYKDTVTMVKENIYKR